jgi:Zn-finger nucleic acid-binding protein
MKCPVDGATLVITDRGGVEIDYCPDCRGVWLDRGELDKIIERSAPPMPPTRSSGRDAYESSDRGYPEGTRRKKRGGFLDELFDF